MSNDHYANYPNDSLFYSILFRDKSVSFFMGKEEVAKKYVFHILKLSISLSKIFNHRLVVLEEGVLTNWNSTIDVFFFIIIHDNFLF